MMSIEYSILEINEGNLELVDEITLRYEHFLGNVSFRHDSGLVELDWGWIPLLDFSFSMFLISKSLRLEKEKEEFEFTESEGKLLFDKINNKIIIKTTYSDEEVTILFDDFQNAICSFCQDLIKTIIVSNKTLVKNAFIRMYQDQLDRYITNHGIKTDTF